MLSAQCALKGSYGSHSRNIWKVCKFVTPSFSEANPFSPLPAPQSPGVCIASTQAKSDLQGQAVLS
jgi:hypothetical protein